MWYCEEVVTAGYRDRRYISGRCWVRGDTVKRGQVFSMRVTFSKYRG